MSETNEQGPAQPGQGSPPPSPPPGPPGPEGDPAPQAGPGPEPAGAEGPLPTFMWTPREEQFIGEMQADDKTMGLLCHLLGIFTSFIGPLVIWLMKKDQSPYVDTQGKEAMNFQLSMLIYIVALGIICMIPFVGCLFYIVAMAVPVFALVMAIIASIKANEGKIYRYPVCIRFIK